MLQKTINLHTQISYRYLLTNINGLPSQGHKWKEQNLSVYTPIDKEKVKSCHLFNF